MRPPHRSAHNPAIGFLDHVLGFTLPDSLDHTQRAVYQCMRVPSMSVGLEGFLSWTVGCNSCSAQPCCTGDAPAAAGAGRGCAHTAAG